MYTQRRFEKNIGMNNKKREKLRNLFKCILIALIWDVNIVLMILGLMKG